MLLYPFCAEAGLFLCVVVPALALPVSLPPVSLPAHKGLGRCGRKQCSLHHHFLRTASHQGCSLKEKADFLRVIMSYDLIKPIQSFLSAVSLIQILHLSEFGKNFLFIWEPVASDLKWLLTLHLITNSGFESKDVRSYMSVCHMLNLAFKFT